MLLLHNWRYSRCTSFFLHFVLAHFSTVVVEHIYIRTLTRLRGTTFRFVWWKCSSKSKKFLVNYCVPQIFWSFIGLTIVFVEMNNTNFFQFEWRKQWYPIRQLANFVKRIQCINSKHLIPIFANTIMVQVNYYHLC